jgi:hypothetical protein
MSTLTRSISTSIHFLKILHVFHNLCLIANSGHFGTLLLEIYIRLVVLTPDFQKVLVYSVIEFLYYSSTTEILVLLMHHFIVYLPYKVDAWQGTVVHA